MAAICKKTSFSLGRLPRYTYESSQCTRWRHAKTYIQIAEDLTGAAEQAAKGCVLQTPTPPITLTLSADALFRFNKSLPADILPKGKIELDEMIVKLKDGIAGVKSLTIVGLTNLLGTKTYNQRLSEARAPTVKLYMVERGVRIPLKDTRTHGASQNMRNAKVVHRTD